ncbi:ribonuclease HI-like [Hypanus sabinus]|uniref:ribonuclease HI-like n=1 Tax=Hypanus sabinus TaxID=79690 RepID=UPI0028C4D348|nr:ribonuclease HI-like [Hypanus sabinus]
MGWAVVKETGEELASGALPEVCSAQLVELVALIEALNYSKGRQANIHPDNRYFFKVVNDYLMAWARRGFESSTGAGIQHGHLIYQLLEAESLPAEVAVIKVKACQKRKSKEQKGNERAGVSVKKAAEQQEPVQIAGIQEETMEASLVKSY